MRDPILSYDILCIGQSRTNPIQKYPEWDFASNSKRFAKRVLFQEGIFA